MLTWLSLALRESAEQADGWKPALGRQEAEHRLCQAPGVARACAARGPVSLTLATGCDMEAAVSLS